MFFGQFRVFYFDWLPECDEHTRNIPICERMHYLKINFWE